MVQECEGGLQPAAQTGNQTGTARQTWRPGKLSDYFTGSQFTNLNVHETKAYSNMIDPTRTTNGIQRPKCCISHSYADICLQRLLHVDRFLQ